MPAKTHDKNVHRFGPVRLTLRFHYKFGSGLKHVSNTTMPPCLCKDTISKLKVALVTREQRLCILWQTFHAVKVVVRQIENQKRLPQRGVPGMWAAEPFTTNTHSTTIRTSWFMLDRTIKLLYVMWFLKTWPCFEQKRLILSPCLQECVISRKAPLKLQPNASIKDISGSTSSDIKSSTLPFNGQLLTSQRIGVPMNEFNVRSIKFCGAKRFMSQPQYLYFIAVFLWQKGAVATCPTHWYSTGPFPRPAAA